MSATARSWARLDLATREFWRVVGRPVDLDGRIFWTAKLANTRIEVLLANLGSSRELYDKLGS